MNEVGKVAGEIWQYLEDNGGSSNSFKLKMALGVNNSVLYLALGWLLREDKVLLEALEKGYKVVRK